MHTEIKCTLSNDVCVGRLPENGLQLQNLNCLGEIASHLQVCLNTIHRR